MINLYHVNFLSPFRVGNQIGSVDYTDHFIHSDTLASAIIDTACTLYNDTTSLIEELKVSSIFYCLKRGRETIYTVPTPFKLPEMEQEGDVSALKKFKKRQLITLDELDQWLKGTLTPEAMRDELNLFTTDARISAVIDRQTGAATPYTRAAVYVNPDVKGYFLADIPEKTVPMLDASLNLLAHRGIGGDRSAGFGQIELVKQQTIPEVFRNKSGKQYFILSLYNPLENEVAMVNPECSYKLEKRSYWFKEGVLTDRYSFFREGSLFDFEPEGRDITLEKPSKKMIKGKPFYVGVSL